MDLRRSADAWEADARGYDPGSLVPTGLVRKWDLLPVMTRRAGCRTSFVCFMHAAFGVRRVSA